MRRVMIGVLVVMVLLVGCGKKEIVEEESKELGWVSKREYIEKELEEFLQVKMVGTKEEYNREYSEWVTRVAPISQRAMLDGSPYEDSDAIVTLVGYSNELDNSIGAEYLRYKVRVLNTKTMAVVDYKVDIKLGKKEGEYYIDGYEEEVTK